MEKIFSIGSYTMSTDGMSLNYTAPAILPTDVIETIVDKNMSSNIEESTKRTFNDALNAILKVPKYS